MVMTMMITTSERKNELVGTTSVTYSEDIFMLVGCPAETIFFKKMYR